MLASAVALLRERSAAGVTVDAVLAHSGAPRGSVYHHFPGGREQLVLEAVGVAGRHVARLIEDPDGPAAPEPAAVVERLLGFWEGVLRDGDHLAGCPVVALTVDGRADQPEVLALVREVFETWHHTLRDVLVRSGIGQARAEGLATLVLAAAEGAVLLSRAQRSNVPLHAVCAELTLLLDGAAGTRWPGNRGDR